MKEGDSNDNIDDNSINTSDYIIGSMWGEYTLHRSDNSNTSNILNLSTSQEIIFQRVKRGLRLFLLTFAV